MPLSLDPAVVTDTESHRVTRQIFEGLVGVDPASGEPRPLLATKWNVSGDGLTYRFTIREGVTFHDGSELTADVVVHNFERWASLTEDPDSNDALSFNAVFHHRASELPAPNAEAPSLGDLTDSILNESPEIPDSIAEGESYFAGCHAEDAHTFVLELNAPLTGLVQALTIPGLAMAAVGSTAEQPLGSGPYEFVETGDGRYSLARFADHWGGTEGVETVEFRVLRDGPSRLRSLLNGSLDGYDAVTTREMRELVRSGQQILQRDPFSVLYLGMNQSSGPLADVLVRRAVSHAIRRNDLLADHFIAGSEEARSFLPPSLGVENPHSYYAYDLDEAQRLLEEADYDGEEIEFLYPLNVTRGYLPLPELTYAVLAAQLTEAGFKIKPVPLGWSDGYLEAIYSQEHTGFHLLGWSGSYRDPDHFLSSIFASAELQFGYDSSRLRRHIASARSMPDSAERTALYGAISELIAQDLPALPLAYPISALTVTPSVTTYPVSPVLDEVIDNVRMTTS
ncbi:ABC transporter substrate-binding protein [Zhihengliuella flava]|uniref:Peptide/nickel transport system substrate-binding protein n=1 Tax=Zhihengliuella flava TaxID=1285193 RepID=A0A931D397_9MICC|nr:ABC transporter substrate-binding protein [Zhihengliuella flava]MBG6083594.1 peptide/nickel transport system substrate-binding protein [Zhihengliuella flava]